MTYVEVECDQTHRASSDYVERVGYVYLKLAILQKSIYQITTFLKSMKSSPISGHILQWMNIPYLNTLGATSIQVLDGVASGNVTSLQKMTCKWKCFQTR